MLFRSLTDKGVTRRRNNDSFPRYPLTCLLGSYQCCRQDEHISYGNAGVAVPPFGCAFSTVTGLKSVLAVANEEGIVRLYNTDNRSSPVLKEWMAHENAVFDIAWVPGEASLVTASGDQMARLWDVKSGELLGSFKGHQCSLKSVSFTQQEKAVFCTGGRDGNIMVWDTRCSKKDGFYRQVKQINGAHNKLKRSTPSYIKKRRPSTRGMGTSVDSQQSVTVVLFCDENTLFSSGAVDGIIKMWDLRKTYTVHHHDPIPLQAYPYPGSSTRKLGYSGLVLDSNGSNLFANCIDDNIYMFNVIGLKTSPVGVFSGHINSTFYVKSTVSPDDQFLASGSSDHHTYIWKIADPKQAPMTLQGHSQEVTSIAWCPTDFTKIASCSDDNTVRIWRLDRGIDGGKSSVGEANLVGWACPKPTPIESTLRPVSQGECTPANSPRPEGLGSLASPQPAACAPSGAAMPLPSNTNSPIQVTGTKVNPLRQRTPPSIQKWFAHTHDSAAKQVNSPLREVLSQCPQSPADTTPSSEWKAKRRLETGDNGSCEGTGECACVTELYPAAKRSRQLLGVSCHTETFHQVESKDSGTGMDLHNDNLPTAPSSLADKENSSPGVADWLSVMGQKLRKGHGTPIGSRSPNGSKRQDGKIPPSLTLCSPQSMKKISSYFHRRAPE